MNYIICTRCVMDKGVNGIVFDSTGVCQVCIEVDQKLLKHNYTSEEEILNLKKLSSNIKQRKQGVYDSILGLSGGVDSSYVALLAKEMKLNPLCVHFDNGWNSETAVKNIRNIIDITGFDLYTYVIDWPEFRDLQRSFIKSNVLDIEMLTDHAIFSVLFKIRKKYGISTVLSGTNYATEHGMPKDWYWNKMDARNIKAIHSRFGEMKMKSFPTMNTLKWLLIRKLKIGGIYEEPLNLIKYSKNKAMADLKESFNWEYYGGKHYESTFTKFYQAYYLPVKFGIDKRKVHLSALIRNGEITREYAIKELSEPLYNPKELAEDKRFVLKKLGFSFEEFNQIMSAQPVQHDQYPTDTKYIKPLIKIGKKLMREIK